MNDSPGFKRRFRQMIADAEQDPADLLRLLLQVLASPRTCKPVRDELASCRRVHETFHAAGRAAEDSPPTSLQGWPPEKIAQHLTLLLHLLDVTENPDA